MTLKILKSFKLIPQTLYFRYLLLFIIIILNVFFELISISLLIPIIAILSGESQNLNFVFQSILDFLYSITSNPNIVLFFLLISFFLKTFFFILLNWLKLSLSTVLVSNLSKRLTEIYINKKLINLINKNSSELIRNCSSEIARFNNNIVLSSINFLTDFFIVASLILFIFFVEFKITFVILSFVIISFGFYFLFFKDTLKKFGKDRQQFEQYKLKNAQTLFHGIRVIKVFLKEKQFINEYFKNVFNLMNLDKKISLILTTPRQLIEFLSVIIFLGLIYFMLNFKQDGNFISILPTLTLFLLAFIRIAPSFNRILLHAQLINSSSATIDLLTEEFSKNKVSNEEEKLENLNIENNINYSSPIKFENVSFRYKNNDLNIFKNLNISFPSKKLIGICGKSGSGKSTFLDILMGLLEPNAGRVLIGNNDIKFFKKDWRNNIAYVSQDNYIFDATITENIAVEFEKSRIDLGKIEKASQLSLTDEIVSKFKEKYKTNIGERGNLLSGGQKQRLALARAIYKDPNIFILDEFTNALDEETEKNLIENFLNFAKGKTIFLSTHNKNLLDLCDEVYQVKNHDLYKVNKINK